MVVGSAYIVVNAITTGFKQQIQDLLDDMEDRFSTAGRSFGSSFSRGASSGFRQVRDDSIQTYLQINRLIERSYYLQGAIGLLVPVLGAVASGLSVIAFQAAAAVPSFIVLGGAITAAIQGMVGFKLAFSGIGKAVSSLTKPGGGIDRMPQLLRAATAAQDRYDDAMSRAKKARDALNESYEQARRELEKLKYDTEDAGINEKRAVIQLEKARETLLRVQDLPPNTRARREAELAYAEADLNLRRARSSVHDLNMDLNKATRNGELNRQEQIDNSKTVLDAIEAEALARREVNRATDAKLLADKELADAKAGKGGGGGEDPFAGLNEYQKEFARFLAGLKPKINDLKLAVSQGLLPALEDAIRLVMTKLFPVIERKMKDTGIALGKASKDFAEAITTPDFIKNFEKNMDTNNYVLENMGIIVGNIARLFSALLAAADPVIRKFTDWIRDLTGGWAKDAEGNISGLTDMFNRSGEIAAGFGDIIGNIVGAFVNIGKAIAGEGGAGQTMMDWFINLSQRFEDFTAKHLASGKLQEYFQTAWRGFQEILRIFGKVVEAILRAGGDGSLEGSMQNVGKGVDAIIDKMPELIAGGAKFAEFVGKFLEMTATFLESGSIRMFFDILSKAMHALTTFFNVPVVAEVFKFVAVIHAARLAFGRLGKVGQKVIKYIDGDIKNMRKTLQSIPTRIDKVKTGFSKFSTAMVAIPGQLKTFGAALKQTSIAQGILNSKFLMSPITWWIAGIVALIAILVVMYKKFDWFRELVDKVWGAMKVGLEAAWEVIKIVGQKIGDFLSAMWKPLSAAFEVAWEAVKVVWDVIFVILKTYVEIVAGILLILWKPIYEVLKVAWEAVKVIWDMIVEGVKFYIDIVTAVLSTVWDWLKKGLELVWSGVKFVWDNVIMPYVSFVVGLVKKVGAPVWNFLSEGISKVWGAVSGFWKNYILPFISGLRGTISRLASGMWDGLKSGLSAVVNFIVRALNLVIDGINLLIKGANAVKIGKDIPPIDRINPVQLAKGGVIPATPGGVLARIGEAGRPERVEPLDEDGLSKRDKAMIKLLSGGQGGGVTMNVYPSPGMDERELAALISRQLAFQLRAGSV